MKLNEIADRAGATHSRKRVGRGVGSGLGKTAGRGHKGQKSRTGVAVKGFEGGQMPIYRRLPKRGFKSLNRKDYSVVNLGRIQEALDSGRLSSDAEVTQESLVAAGLARSSSDGVRLLGEGELKAKATFRVHGASKSAIEAVEKAGGSVEIIADRKAADAETAAG